MAIGELLRETKWFSAYTAPRGVRIVAKERGVKPKSRTIKPHEWRYLNAHCSDETFMASCVYEFGIGVKQA